MTGVDDSELQARFAEMRSADRGAARGVDAVLGLRRRVRRVPHTVVIVASAALVFAGLSLVQRRPLVPVGAITEWRAPSDVLLESSFPSVLGPMSPLGASVLDEFIPTSAR